MKASRILSLLLFLAATALVVASRQWSSGQELVAPATAVLQPLKEPVLAVEPSLPEEMPRMVEAPPVAIEEPKTPVQPLEGRRDAMLFECEALFDSPFGQAIVMPFD